VLCWHAVLTQEATVCTSLDCTGKCGQSPVVRDVLPQHRPCQSSEFMMLFTGPSSWCFMCFITFMARYHVLLRISPISLLKFLRCSWISVASFTNAVHAACHSCQYRCVPDVLPCCCVSPLLTHLVGMIMMIMVQRPAKIHPLFIHSHLADTVSNAMYIQ
jgi:hypothetical protein